MLVLSRHKDESIVIGEQIEVVVVDIRGDKVRLGVTAPRNVSVHRREVYDAIRKENIAASGLQPGDVSMNADSTRPLPIAVLVSGSGRTLANLIDRIANRSVNAAINLVIGSRPGLLGVERAAAAGLPNVIVPRSGFGDVASFSAAVFDHLDRAGVELACLGGWLSLLEIPPHWFGRVMNIHPSLLPSFGGSGMYGNRVHEAVLSHGCRVSGCTVHFVDNSYDTGPIIVQRTCDVREDDTPQSLAARVFEIECVAYPEAIRLFQQNRLRMDGRRVRVAPQ